MSRPALEDDLARYLDWLAGAGVPFAVDADLRRVPDHDGPLVGDPAPRREIRLDGLPPIVERRDPAAGIAADHASEMVARELARRDVLAPGETLWDIGCGTGVLAACAAGLGARDVVGADVDPRAVWLARATAEANGVAVEVREGALFDPFAPERRADVVIANLPHKPVPDGALAIAQAGGPDGTTCHDALAAAAPGRLTAGGRVVFFLHSLPPPSLLAGYAKGFDLTLLAWKRRLLGAAEYGALQAAFRARAAAGSSFLVALGERAAMIAGVWSARRRE